MNAVSVQTAIVQASANAKPSAQKTESINAIGSSSFQSILGEVAKTAPASAKTDAGAKVTSGKELLAQIIDKINSGASGEEIAQLLSGLSDDQKAGLGELLKKLMTIISNAIDSTKQGEGKSQSEKLTSALSDLVKENSDNKENQDMLELLVAMLFSAPTELSTKPNSEQSATSQNATPSTSVSSISNTQVISATELQVIKNILASSNPQELLSQLAQIPATDDVTKATTSPLTEIIQSISQAQPKLEDLQGMQTKLNKLLEAVSQKTGIPAEEVKAVTSTMTSENSGVKLTAEGQSTKLAALSNKVVKNTSEFDEIMAAAQGVKPQAVQTAQTPEQTQPVEIPVEKQVSQAVLNQLSSKLEANNVQEMTLKLNPKELGEVSIKLVKAGGEITISIAAQNLTTQKLLQEKLPTLVSNLQSTNSEVKDVQIVSPNQNASAFMSGFSLSDSNSSNQYKASQSQSSYNYDATPTEEVEKPKEFVGEAKLWQTA